MILSPEEQKIVKRLYTAKRYNFQSYITEFFAGTEITNIIRENKNVPDHVKLRAIVITNTTNLQLKCATFFILMKKLEDAKLVYKFSIPDNIFWEYYEKTDDNYERLDVLDRFITKDDFSQYIIATEFTTFALNDYRTFEDMNKEREYKEREEEKRLRLKMYEDEKIDRKEAQNTTRLIGYASIIASVLMTLITVIVNIYTFTNERKVEIVNSKLEPTKVYLVNPETIQKLPNKPIDSIKVVSDKIQISKR